MASHNAKKKFPPEVYTREEVMSLMGACSKRAPTGKRDRALICVLWRGQLRISEALALKPAAFDEDKQLLHVLGKGRVSRVVVMDRQACDVLNSWLEVRKGLGFDGHQPIFCTLKGGSIDPAQIREKLPKLAKNAGIERRIHAHGLRHTGASEMAEEGVMLLDIQAQLGHSSSSTTDRYLHTLNPTGRAERLKKREW